MTPLIAYDHYWIGPGFEHRDELYAIELNTEIRANAMRWAAVANELAESLQQRGIALSIHPKTGTPLSSGWRPSHVNASTPGAAVHSLHMTGQAGDVYDPDGMIDDYLFDNQDLLAMFGVWLEHPGSTKGWSHWQTVPPGSKKRVFYP